MEFHIRFVFKYLTYLILELETFANLIKIEVFQNYTFVHTPSNHFLATFGETFVGDFQSL